MTARQHLKLNENTRTRATIVHSGNDAQLDCICMTANSTVRGTEAGATRVIQNCCGSELSNRREA